MAFLKVISIFRIRAKTTTAAKAMFRMDNFQDVGVVCVLVADVVDQLVAISSHHEDVCVVTIVHFYIHGDHRMVHPYSRLSACIAG